MERRVLRECCINTVNAAYTELNAPRRNVSNLIQSDITCPSETRPVWCA